MILYRTALTASLGVALCCLIAGACSGPDERALDARRHAREKRVQDLASRHEANYRWDEQFEESARIQFLTVEIQNVLLRTNTRPIIIVGLLSDLIAVGADHYELRAQARVGLSTIYFILRADEPIVRALLSDPPAYLQEDVAVVARLQAVSRPILQLTSDEPAEGDMVPPNVVLAPGDDLIARGECLEIARLDAH
jgi:hypothetical protein